jgi:hypothetical protein
MVDVQSGKILGRIRRFGSSRVGVAPGTGGIGAGVGRSRAMRMAWQTIQWEVRATTKHGQNCSICGSGVQVPLLAEWAGFMHPASHRTTTIEDVLIHILAML